MQTDCLIFRVTAHIVHLIITSVNSIENDLKFIIEQYFELNNIFQRIFTLSNISINISCSFTLNYSTTRKC